MTKNYLATTIGRRSLTESLTRRVAIEETAARTGRTFRRHPGRMLAERLFVKPLLRFGLGLTGLYSTGVRNSLSPVVRNLCLTFKDLPEDFDGYRILHLADPHIDSLDELAETVAAVTENLEPDLCLMTGDYRFGTEGPIEKALAGMRRVLSSISAPDGVVAILGNHDPAEMAYSLDKLGVQMLINDAVEITRGRQALWIAGVDDSYDYRCHDLATALEQVPPGTFRILLSHTPDLYESASQADINLYLCGHTHAGQVRLPWIGSVIQNSDAPRAYTHGYWKHAEMQAYTSAGIGSSMLPIRFNCPPEIVMLELRCARQ